MSNEYEAFIKDILEVYRRHGLAISYSGRGSLDIERFREVHEDELRDANIFDEHGNDAGTVREPYAKSE